MSPDTCPMKEKHAAMTRRPGRYCPSCLFGKPAHVDAEMVLADEPFAIAEGEFEADPTAETAPRRIDTSQRVAMAKTDKKAS